jgi:hypothetical protein
MPPLLSPISGKVCFTNNPLNTNASPRTDCVSYGNFPAQTGTDSGGCTPDVPAGPPTFALPIMNTVSLKRTSTAPCGSVPNSDFAINNTHTDERCGKDAHYPASHPSRPGRESVQRRDFPGQWADLRNLSRSEPELRVAAEQYPVPIQYRLRDLRSAVPRRDEAVQLRCRLRL